MVMILNIDYKNKGIIMNISEHKKTWTGFIKFTKIMTVGIILLLTVMAATLI